MKEYRFKEPKKVKTEDLRGEGRKIELTPTVERILRTRLSKLEYWQRLGRAGLERYPGTEKNRENFIYKLDKDLKEIKHLKEVLSE